MTLHVDPRHNVFVRI